MHVLDVNEIFWVTFYTFDRIMELWWKNWPDAYALYTKLVKQSRIQQTNQTKSLNAFLREWLGWWDERLKKARHVLKQLWLIDDIVVRDKLWKISWHYVRVNFLINENKVRNTCMTYDLSTEALNQDMANPTSGQTDTNALSTKYINALSTKHKICPENVKNADISRYNVGFDPDNSKERKEKVAPKEKKESSIPNYSEEFEEFWKLYPAPSWRWSKKDSRKKWNSWNNEDIDKIKLKILEECVYVKSWKKERQWVCALEKFLENNRWVDVDIEWLVNTYMKYTWDIKKKWLDLMKEYFWEDLIKRYIFKYIKENENFNLDLH